MELDKAIDILWEVKESKKHPNKAFKELCVLFGVSESYVRCWNCKFYKHKEITNAENGYCLHHKCDVDYAKSQYCDKYKRCGNFR